MDSLTHLALGAIIGDAMGSKEIGKKAMVIGAVSQFIPDIDFIAALWSSPAETLVAHRGLTHSLAFGVLSVLILTIIFRKVFSQGSISTKGWLLFFGVQAATHIFVDIFNAYGVGLFEPFNAIRLSLHSIYVFDPLFSLWALVAAIVLIFVRRNSPLRLRWSMLALVASSLYLLASLGVKTFVNREVRSALKHDQVNYNDFTTTPTPFNTLLWYVIAKTDSGYYTGYRSIFDTSQTINLNYFAQNNEIKLASNAQVDDSKLISLSQDYYVYSQRQDTLSISLLIFGQIAGWSDLNAPFVLRCDLSPEETSLAMLQEGRSKEMNAASLSLLLTRIFNQPKP